MRRLPAIALTFAAAVFVALLSCGDAPPICLPACAKDEVCTETKEQIPGFTKWTYRCEPKAAKLTVVDGGVEEGDGG